MNGATDELCERIINAPSSVFGILPFPPNKLVPPMITAAIASNSIPAPTSGLAAPSLEVIIKPAIEAQLPLKTKAFMVTAVVFTPENFAASRLPPVALR